ncbi:hypothetical protein M2451_001734 [Dysgonomonas sp. PFB1-18]|uniref:hypothetical protein n=1 Tax=unclassified Dysgonomonas TaxID=2630389 RepID=UPI00247505B2|nr:MULTISPECIES: hypothetical protein [unclassified Dysgonomonas]MDH6309163.1 hypothetical protein [Dysgonomonas sp. PF1-14]MDH6338957.1 hypothetical protein [Dysgonomonas sp. PF1-16]MDH6380412.1 hypothetical protein [Dysgonomonas sp. PFB1-18]MDH6397785.1 hypothetical protein [Dysgonomonas sp. PF1-23]
MTKRAIKIVILFVLIITILIGGWFMYKRLEYNKESYTTNIYDYISPQFSEVININKEYNLSELYTYDSTLVELTRIPDREISYPLVICKRNNGERLLISKAKRGEAGNIIKHIEGHIAQPFAPKSKIYRDAKILIYTLSDNRFLACTFHKGLFAASGNYKLIEDLVGTTADNSFFTDRENTEIIEKKLASAPVSIAVGNEKNLLIMDYKADNDTISLNGIILKKNSSDSLTTEKVLTPYFNKLPDNLCIDRYDISDENNLPAFRVILNKMY